MNTWQSHKQKPYVEEWRCEVDDGYVAFLTYEEARELQVALHAVDVPSRVTRANPPTWGVTRMTREEKV